MNQFLKQGILLVLVCLCTTLSPLLCADSDASSRRIDIGLRLFRALLASDTELSNKTDANKQLNLALISSKDPASIQFYINELMNSGRANKKGKIHGYPIKVSAYSIDQLLSLPANHLAGIFILDKLLPAALQAIIDYGIKHQIVIYSPYEGDVQQGVLAGISVDIKVRPLINQETMQKSQLLIKALFLKVAKIYEN